MQSAAVLSSSQQTPWPQQNECDESGEDPKIRPANEKRVQHLKKLLLSSEARSLSKGLLDVVSIRVCSQWCCIFRTKDQL